MSFDPRQVALAVREHRKAAGLTQAELAEKAGLAFETISRVESGREPPSLRTAVAIADALGVSLDAVVGRSAKAPPRRRWPAPEARRLASAAERLEPSVLKHLSAIAARLVGAAGRSARKRGSTPGRRGGHR